MQIRILTTVTLQVCNFDWDSQEDLTYLRQFKAGEVYRVGEISPVNERFDVIEFELIGFCEIPRSAWAKDESRILFFPERVSLN